MKSPHHAKLCFSYYIITIKHRFVNCTGKIFRKKLVLMTYTIQFFRQKIIFLLDRVVLLNYLNALWRYSNENKNGDN